jgi:hypothetical protein
MNFVNQIERSVDEILRGGAGGACTTVALEFRRRTDITAGSPGSQRAPTD